MNSSEVIIWRIVFAISFFICFIVYLVNFFGKYKVYEEAVAQYEKWCKWFNYRKYFKKDDDYWNTLISRPPIPTSPMPELIIVLIIGGVFTYAFGIIKIYLIIVLPLIWLAAKIKRLI